jgi:rRNA maturation endonuclease Nob1
MPRKTGKSRRRCQYCKRAYAEEAWLEDGLKCPNCGGEVNTLLTIDEGDSIGGGGGGQDGLYKPERG